MKQYIWILAILLSLGISSCKDHEAYFANIEQDRDDDVITGDDYVYHIPVIFHVLYNNANAVDTCNNRTQYTAYSRLVEILQNVNDLYAGELYNFGDSTKSENIHIQFELALTNENGEKLATPGVEYIYCKDYPIDSNQFMTAKKTKNKIIWDPNEFVNVMLYNFKPSSDNTVVLGVSHLPYTANGYPGIEGLNNGQSAVISKDRISFEYCVSINSLFAYSESSRYTQSDHGANGFTYLSTDINATLAHELGHYLGLHHAFAEQNNTGNSESSVFADNCDDTDYCEDTKSYNRVKYSTWRAKYLKENKSPVMADLLKRSNDNGDEWIANNFMDYDVCLSDHFTADQKYRMRQVLYYSPLMPGPKKNRNAAQTRAEDNDEPLDLPIRIAIDKVKPYSKYIQVKP